MCIRDRSHRAIQFSFHVDVEQTTDINYNNELPHKLQCTFLTPFNSVTFSVTLSVFDHNSNFILILFIYYIN